MPRLFTHLVFGAFACLPSLLLAQPDGPIGQVHQELVGGTLTDTQTQQDFGLLTLLNPSGTCSASMLNDYWAITAAHCVFVSTTAVSAQFSPNQISLTANWPGNTKTVQALQIVAFSGFPFTPDDVALIQVSRHAFAGPVPRTRTLRAARPMANLPIQAFGRGINQLASLTAAGAIVSSSGDGKFRSAFFDIASINPNSSTPPQTYSYPGKNGAIVAGGDSGGPSYFQDFDNPLSTRRKLEWQLIGVHSRCGTTCLAGQSCTGVNVWKFVTSIQSCSDATILPIRDRILATIEQPPADDSPTGTFNTTVPDSVLKHKRALYAVNIDEPLIAPANAAIDIQLTFAQCHSRLRINQTGCPLAPPFQIWSYDPATHRILHVPSGKCLNISGARRDPGAPIILFQCVGAPNEKWSIVAPPGRSTWTIKSDLNGLCLTAIPGIGGGGNGKMLTLPRPGLLTQAACNGSTAQLFDDADANFAVRNGPH
jgi:hypothetical protein